MFSVEGALLLNDVKEKLVEERMFQHNQKAAVIEDNLPRRQRIHKLTV